MSDRQENERPVESATPKPTRPGTLRGLRANIGVSVALLLVIWVGFTLLPESTGVSFGLFYQGFFSVMVVTGSAFFWLLDLDSVPHPRSAIGVLGSLLLVYLGTVGFMVLVGVAFPQFEGAPAEADEPQDATARGGALFWSANPGCFLCHSIDGAGGLRAPDLTDLVSVAGDRVAGVSAEGYIEAKIRQGMEYEYLVPDYTPMMIPFEGVLDDDQISDLIAFLIGPR
ncbi:MAG: cytochrome c [SAR202 cluster bacterium]|jgi:mono/diheme cytochrome c family protein|nr:hypothetical protein [Chloroflexota bacterium]MDP6422267.1 cytochrome c [SAR202 cluster bacterium]HAL49590.1 hypothetical protein [Dehalococcoidia bacterium]MDP6663171.1 cytochrome c [SAR202 cluster bacterium]MDP6800992.1 cytochrome c [SAR202 cluster bacterium]|tara:strand:+ start:2436 stop:3116 length:681 start_codon:yes stop_codon:yes gene_type:complete